ncbi:MAG TPA: hypothetical protein VF519_08160 [Mycobacteriales bacterium]|jgi:hypothetical protein
MSALAPDDWPTLRDAVPASEATVIRSLLDAYGIPVVLEPLGANGWLTMSQPHANGPFRLRVAPADLATAEELLA